MTDSETPAPGSRPPVMPWGGAAENGGSSNPAADQFAKAALPPEADTQPIGFVAKGSIFLRLIIRGAFLQLLTFGFYRFWLTTDIRRHLWSHTMVDKEGAEYTGTGKELLIGFLFAMAVLTPIYLVYFLIGIEAERAQAFASVPLFLIMVLFGYFAIYRARRYRLSRTVWRGVRFWMTGSGWSYAFRSFGWLILVFLTVGLLYPWRAASLEKYKMKHTYYGNMRGEFTATGWQFFKRGVWLWLLALLPIVLWFVILGQYGSNQFRSGQAFVATFTLMFLSSLIWVIIWPAFVALEWRWWATGIRIGEAELSCSLRGGQVFKLYLKFALAVFLFSIVFSIVLALVVGLIALVFGALGGVDLSELFLRISSTSPYLAIAGTAFSYLVFALAFGVMQRYFLQYRFWILMCSMMTVTKVKSLEGAKGEGELAGALGEGLADGLDIGGF